MKSLWQLVVVVAVFTFSLVQTGASQCDGKDLLLFFWRSSASNIIVDVPLLSAAIKNYSCIVSQSFATYISV